MSTPTPEQTGETMTWPEKLREAAKWFDTVDSLLELLQVEVTATGETYKLIDKLGRSTEIQDDLRRLADLITQHDAERERGYCFAPFEFMDVDGSKSGSSGGSL